MISYLKSENLKFKRTFSRKFIFFSPVCIAIFSYIVFCSVPEAQSFYSYSVYNWWALLFVPLGTTLFCVLAMLKDKKMYSFLISRGINKRINWLSKIFIVIWYLLITHIWLFIFFEITNYFIFGSFINVVDFFCATMLAFLTSISLVPINLFLEYKTSTLITFAVSFIGLILAVRLSPTTIWFISPWGYALRFMCPILGIQPNGLPIEPFDYLMDVSVVPKGIFLCVFILIFSAFITTILMDNERGE